MEYIIWKAVVGYENFYEVSNTGLVIGLQRTLIRKDGKLYLAKSRLLSFKFDKDGYASVVLQNFGSKYRRVHRLVAEAFIENPENKPQVNHKNGIKNDNIVDNLEWSTQSENELHSFHILGKQVVNKKTVCQYSKDGVFIKKWDSLTIAAVKLGLQRSNIKLTAQGKRNFCGGYIWKYAS